MLLSRKHPLSGRVCSCISCISWTIAQWTRQSVQGGPELWRGWRSEALGHKFPIAGENLWNLLVFSDIKLWSGSLRRSFKCQKISQVNAILLRLPLYGTLFTHSFDLAPSSAATTPFDPTPNVSLPHSIPFNLGTPFCRHHGGEHSNVCCKQWKPEKKAEAESTYLLVC